MLNSYNRCDNRFDNRLYRVNGALKAGVLKVNGILGIVAKLFRGNKIE